ncbi:hypothetical protein GUITHDRAFT_86181 [Guillardia theta CCMP2712]|uniref:TPM domain-containing protein n=1 Tax=Guillardia theta (strain CCMP2712) TaxID=905079 RepID=L1JI44_GUITC|nr:hypothetical protein GUITHDRAFT_86181 [Guillardia theta CCMP2712]EKX48171.1 hypothetical protein GUITHDRAFT_86181 [Guillardia theta CCMP2712]|eukprot:XP_005835151.1 hypothetical protein GUITHDRAFT_86181 [Guillardia theta CCMP2712]
MAGISWLLLPLSCLAASPIIDEARSLGSNERGRLEENLNKFEEETNYRVRVLTIDERRLDEKLTREQVKKAWNLPDERSLIVILQAGKGNVLSFNAGAEVSKLLPARFFNELSGRMGNVYSIGESGENSAIEESVSIIEKCLRKGGCALVPGIGEDQYYATLACTSMSGLIFGLASLASYKEFQKKPKQRELFYQYTPVFLSPLWGVFLSLGIQPLIARDADLHYTLQNAGDGPSPPSGGRRERLVFQEVSVSTETED